MQSSTRLSWGLLLGLLSGCQSQQAAFQFHPAPPATAQAAPLLPPVAKPTAEPTAEPVPAYSPEGKPMRPAPVAQRPVPTASRKARLPLKPGAIPLLSRMAAPQRRTETAAATKANQPARHDTLHIILGALLVVGGVVGGIALGGWLGLGVGAVVVLLGYYFLVLGIGGKHAWLEIFQEFFNM